MGVNGVWGQTDYSGTYYIGTNGYKANNTANNFYLCPTEGWCYYQATDDFTGTPNGMPFLTTHKCRDGEYNVTEKAIWFVEKHPTQDYYYIKRAFDGKYVVLNGQIRTTTNNANGSNRLRVHIEALDNPDDKALFALIPNGTAYNIKPKTLETYLTVNGGNDNSLTGVSGKADGPDGYKNTKGIIGIYPTTDGNSNFYLEKAISINPPTITNNETVTNTFTITAAEGATIYYTTNEDTPTTSTPTNGTTSVNITQTEGMTVIKAIAKATNDPFSTPVVTYNVPACERPTITVRGGTVSITCATEGAAIHYTTDGSPAMASSTLYAGPFAKGDATTIRAIATKVGYLNSNEAVFVPPFEVSSSDQIQDMSGNYILTDNFTLTASIGTSDNPFSGTIDGQLNTLTLSYPLVAYANGAIIKNVILDNVSISGGTNVGAICNEATGDSRIYNCGILSGSVSGSGKVGGLVGLLDGTSRVINCYSYANVSGGSDSDVGGIVGYNNYASTADDLRTMVMNCMFYGDITGGTNVSPVYGGLNISNGHGGLNTYNYYAYDQATTFAARADNNTKKYNNALAVEDIYLKRFEMYRLLLNSNKRLAAFYATGDMENTDEMAKWVLETANRSITGRTPYTYPILKEQDKYPSIINYDVNNAPTLTLENDKPKEEDRNKGGKLGNKTLNVHISGTGITSQTIEIARTDKDFERYNFNYDKIQLPYYNDYGTENYKNNKVVTGWKITEMTGGTAGEYKAKDEWGGFNFADRKCTNKDLYSVSGRVFSQGAYFDVPYGVTDIYIEPYWGKAVYVADEYLDVVYNTSYSAQQVSGLVKQFPDGKITINSSEQTVYTSISSALNNLKDVNNPTVYDYAVVLVGNLHQNTVPSNGTKPFTIMSADLNHDNEPDYSMIYHHSNRQAVCPIRFDFLNIPGTAQAQKPNGASNILNFTIFLMKGWFEITNTCIVYSNQVEYENTQDNKAKAANSPLILLGGNFEQFVSTRASEVPGKTNYVHVGSNVFIKNFGMGTHSDGNKATPHIPVSVTGGEYEGFYLSGTYNPNAETNANDHAECYISSGHFIEAAGAAQEQIDGNVHWQIYNADIDNFYGGGINDTKPIKGTITTDIFNSYVGTFCGGPKFGNMQTGKVVTTNAEGCTFNEYFGAGYGGLSYSRQKYYDESSYSFSKYQNTYNGELGNYYDGNSTDANKDHADYGKKGKGVATDYDYEFFVWSTGVVGARFFVKFATFSLAQCENVESNLKNCIINKNFYGGGKLGNVSDKATSVLDGCTVHGNVFGGGYSADIPEIPVRKNWFATNPKFNQNTGIFEKVDLPDPVNYDWKHVADLPTTEGAPGTEDNKYVLTDVNLDALGKVGYTDLTVKGNTKVEGKTFDANGDEIGTPSGGVFGGGDESAVNHNTKVKIEATATEGVLNVFGGGNTADVDGNTEVNMTSGTVTQDVYGGGKGASTVVGGNVTVNLGTKGGESAPFTYTGTGTVQGNVYGGSALGAVNAKKEGNSTLYSGTDADPKTTSVNIYSGTINGNVFGGGLGHDDTDNTKDIVAKNFGNTTVTIENSDNAKALVKTAVYGGANENGVVKANTEVTITGGTIGTAPEPATNIVNTVFGGGFGQPTLVEGDVTVNIGTKTDGETPVYAGAAVIYGSVYGGSALGGVNVNEAGDDQTAKAIAVNLYGGIINGNVFGGGLGQKNGENGATSDIAARVGGGVNVLLDGAKLVTQHLGSKTDSNDDRTFVSGQIFGCNNLNGSPKGHVKVHVKRTVGSEKSDATPRDSRTTYDVAAVYGGGNKADYIPTNATLVTDPSAEGYDAGNPAKVAAACAEVLVEGCDLTSIEYVYGGGNAAAVPATAVTILGDYIINYVFGGGNGKSTTDAPNNPGADVGISDRTAYATDPTTGIYGTGKAETKLVGGHIMYVFGGSNTKGNVRGGTSVTMPEKDPTYTSDDCCNVRDIKEIYGAGNQAEQDGAVTMILGCVNNMDYVYGGARAANVKGGVDLVVTSGHFRGVFGGNDQSGTIQGPITLTIEETGCDPLVIDNLYLGGNQAAYSVFGYKDESGTLKPRSSINDGTAVNPPKTSYSEAQLYRDPILNIISCTSIGNAFGGGLGSGAVMYGNPSVNVNMIPGDFAAQIDRDNTSGADNDATALGTIGNVYGGGEEANVEGNTAVNICTEEEVAVRSQKGAPITGTQTAVQGALITDNVFGAGKGKDTNVNLALVSGNTTILMAKGSVAKSIYGGGELSQVGGNTNITVKGGTIGTSGQGAAVYGNVYGGGLGKDANEFAFGLVKGNTNILIENVVADAAWVEAHEGTTVKVGDILSTPTILHNIYGGGAYGSVGTYSVENDVTTCTAGGTANITITGGTIGTNGHENGMIFGASRGDVGAPGSDHDKLAWINNTNVIIGTENATTGPSIKGSVYGGGENGHVYNNASVTIHSGMVGITDTNIDGGSAYALRGNVYGGGCGTDKYDNNTKFNPLAGIVQGNTTVLIDGGHVVRDVYGAGAMGAVTGSTNVTIGGSAEIGAEGDNSGGYVFAAARGEQSEPTMATVGSSNLTISGGTVWCDAYGGGQNGYVNGAVTVNLTGGTVKQDVYGGGALANTNTDNWVNNSLVYADDAVEEVTGLTPSTSPVDGYFTRSGNSSPYTYTPALGKAKSGEKYYRILKATTVNLSGTTIVGNLYGGGLGQKNGENGATSDIVANVYGPSTITITSGKANNVFGCNNLNGAPHTAAMVFNNGGTITHDIYGGGNKANFDGSTIVKLSSGQADRIFGGGNEADVAGSVNVVICGGKVINDVYGGGALAKTNTANWNFNAGDKTIYIVVLGLSKEKYVEKLGLVVGVSPVSGLYRRTGGSGTDNDPYTYTEATGLAQENTQYYEKIPASSLKGLYSEQSENSLITADDLYDGTGTYYEARTIHGDWADGMNAASSETVTGRGPTTGGTKHKTLVTLTGGIVGNVYGGGLGRLGTSGVAAQAATYHTAETAATYNATLDGALNSTDALTAAQASAYNTAMSPATNKEAGNTLSSEEAAAYNATLDGAKSAGDLKTPAVEAVAAIEEVKANVYGDVRVSINRTDSISKYGGSRVAFSNDPQNVVTTSGTSYSSVPLKGRVFGCNNLNGCPLGDVLVEVYGTRPEDGSSGHKNYEVQAVYGGGDQADYLPNEGKKTYVVIDGCGETSISRIYGGGNSAAVPSTNVTIWGSYDIEYAFGGGNGSQPVKKFGNWVDNTGADVNGAANITCHGGKIGQVFGGSDAKGYCRSTNPVLEQSGGCPLVITKLYGAGSEADVEGSVNVVIAACTETNSQIEYVCGGSYKAHITGDVTLTITSGFFKNVYGGNDMRGGIGGNITVNIEETDPCDKPIIIENLVGGGNRAKYPGTDKDGNSFPDLAEPRKITVNVKSATRIDNVYGGGFIEEATANTQVNINMVQGDKHNKDVLLPVDYELYSKPEGGIYHNISNIKTAYAEVTGLTVGTSSVVGYYTDASGTTPAEGVAQANVTYYKKQVTGHIDDAIGTIGNVYGGGQRGKVDGSTEVNIGTATEVDIMERDEDHKIKATYDTDGKITNISYVSQSVLGAHITGDVFGGGEEANVTGSTEVNICTKETAPGEYAAVTEGAEKVTIGGTVYGGGSKADVLTNTTVRMYNGYVFNGIFGGGYSGSVGTFERAYDGDAVKVYGHTPHTGCIGKPVSCAEGTGTCTVVVDGGQIGPVTVVTEGMTRSANNGGPVAEGWIWGGGCGLIENPEDEPDTHFKTYVNETNVTISGSALIMESVIGGGEFGRVLHNTNVTIAGGQIGASKVDANNKPVRYDESAFIDPTTATASDIETAAGNMPECSHFPYGNSNNEYLPYDPYYKDFTQYVSAHPDLSPASTDNPSDGKSWIGCVFGGGSGYMPYKIKEGNNAVGYDWCRSAGWVEGNTNVEIKGGHILTNVYGGNEYTDVGTPGVANTGKCTVIMSGGTIGVPRTLQQIADHPVTCYLFGGGKGDERTHFDQFTNVNSVEVEVSGGIIYGSVFGGAEDGHVLGDAKVVIKDNAKIGTWGTSYVDGNVFGGGRGFSGKNLIAGGVGGNTQINITGGTMLGSIYGGGRLASVGIDLNEKQGSDSYGQLKDETGNQNAPTYGHITIDISGGKIGTTTETGTDHPVGGNVFGGSMGRTTLLDGSTNPMWPKMAVAKLTKVDISGGEIMNNVYGGSEYGIVRNRATVNILPNATPANSPVIHGHVFGGGYGSDEREPTTIRAGGYSSIPTSYYTFTPMTWTGCVSGDTNVNISGGKVEKNVYGGGEYASVGLINFNSEENGTYNYITKHESLTDGFGLSWPYKFQYIKAAPNDAESVGGNKLGGKATVTITGGHIGSTTWDDRTGYVFGGSKGQVAFKKKVGNDLVNVTDIHEQRYIEGLCANVRETEVNVNYTSTPSDKNTGNIGAEDNCIMGAVYGGGEDGHVYENAAVNITNGLIGLSVYGGGKGISTYQGYLRDESTKAYKSTKDNLYSWTAGKVYGNTRITMTGGHVLNNVYGGGYLGSVGKGNYSGGADDYFPSGYGETLTGNLWTSASEGDDAWEFLHSGKATVIIEGGTVGTLNGTYGSVGGDNSMATPTGMVFGGSRGQAAEDIMLDPRYEYAPNFYLGYVNETEVTIGTESNGGPRLYGQVFGGGRDGHVRGSAHVIVNDGTIGQTYAETTAAGGNDAKYHRYHRGNVYGSGSGLGLWDSSHHGMSSGSVTRNTTVDINGGTIYNNVYGGGALSSVGPPRIDLTKDYAAATWSKCVVNINGGTIGQTADYNSYKYGGCVYGASRGNDFAAGETPENFATVLWTEVNINGGNIAGNVYGGAKGGLVWKDTEVNLKGGTIAHNAYGGGQGTTDIAANVLGNTTVELNNNNDGGDADGSKKGCIIDKVFGCNDLNGTPKGHVLVHVYATQNANTANISTKVAPPEYTSTKGSSEAYAVYLKRLIDVAKPNGTVLVGIDEDKISSAESVYTTYMDKVDASLTDVEKKNITDAAKTVINQLESLHDYDVAAVYGGGDLAPYEPTSTTENTEVIIEGCAVTSIKQVYGGGNAASVPATDVLVKSCAIIDELFGGGNGKDSYQFTDDKWYENPGANVGYKNYTHHNTSDAEKDGSEEAKAYPAVEDATTPEDREAYKYGKGTAYSIVNGGHIHTVYGGSNMKGNISNNIEMQLLQAGTCTLVTDEAYASSKSAETDAESKLVLDCVKEGGTIFGGSYNANLNSDVNIIITNGHYEKVFGGNNQAGTINGKITITIQEAGCTPITIGELYGGGYLAPYSIYGYKTETQNAKDKDGNDLYDESHNLVKQRIPYKPGEAGALATPYWNPRINIVSATSIGKIFGGGYGAGATMIGSPHINVNMEKGMILKKYASDDPSYASLPDDAAGNKILSIGTIGDIYGGGELADVIGNTYVEIGTGQWISEWDANGNPVWETTNTSGEKLLYKLETPAVTYTPEECNTYNEALTGALSLTDVVYSFTSYADNSGNTQHGSGIVKQVSQADGWTTVQVVTNTTVDANAPSFVGQQFKVNATNLDTNTYYPLYTTGEPATETGIYVKVTSSSPEAYNATLTGARNTNDIKTAAVWAWYDEHGESAAAPTTTGRNAATITGNVFGGGKGETKNTGDGAFKCASAMVGADGDGLIDANGGTSVTIANGTVGTLEGEKLKAGTGNVYGGGELGRVEKNTVVTIGVQGNTTNEVTIRGNVFGAGKGIATHGYAALVRGNSTVTIQGKSKVGGSVYGGGEIASVGRYNVNATTGLPESLKNEKSGNCTVIVRDDAEIGPDDMTMTKEGGPDNSGHVFGAGMGATPGVYSSAQHMTPNNELVTGFTTEEDYLTFIESLGLATQTNVTISGNAFVKGDVFGGAEQGFVQHDTHVIIEGDCQIGNGYVQMADDGTYLANPLSVNRRYTTTEWSQGKLIMGNDDRKALKDLVSTTNYTSSLPECASWEYGQASGAAKYAAHDIYAGATGYDSKGGSKIADNGSTFYGNVFGGGSGYFPYAAGKWHWKAGDVGGNTLVEIKGGHILTNVYGGNELTNVTGKCTVNMSGGTIGVPRTLGQIAAHPVTCYLFGGGKGDPRVLFNKQTNVQDVEVNINGGWIYGSAFGGGEDGHVMRNVTMNISGNETDKTTYAEAYADLYEGNATRIGTWGTSYVDGNIFGGGRGFAGDAYTAGNVAGSVTMNITGGTMLGSIYGGGRLGSVGYGLYEATETDKYGTMRPDNYADDGTTEVANFKRGYVTMNISGGTIGNDYEFIMPNATNIAAAGINEEDISKWKPESENNSEWTTWKNYHHVPNTVYDTSNGRLLHTKGGNVFAGSMGRRTQLDGTSEITAIDWMKLGAAKSTKLTITGGATIKSNVYGGGEFGAIRSYVNGETVEGGTTSIDIQGGTIGTEIKETVTEGEEPNTTTTEVTRYTFGSVYGGGYGTEAEIGKIATNAQVNHLGALVDGNTTVSMSDGHVWASVFGGGEVAAVGGDTEVTISGGKIGKGEVKPKTDTDPGYVMFGGATMGNVYGGGKGNKTHTLLGVVKGNTNVTINAGTVTGEPFIYHNVYGGGALGSVGTFNFSDGETGDMATVPEGVPMIWTSGGTATVNILGGTIGISGRDNGMVNGSSRGDIAKPVPTKMGNSTVDKDPYDKMAWVEQSIVNIGETATTGPHVKGSVYGGGENGHVFTHATVNVKSGTIGIVDETDPWYDFGDDKINEKAWITRGNIYGAGCGTDTYWDDKNSNNNVDPGEELHNPWSGCVIGNTEVNISGGLIAQSVYGGGSMGSVGRLLEDEIVVHGDVNNGFALSWPVELKYGNMGTDLSIPTGKATINITGGRVGTTGSDNGDVFGGTRGEAGHRYDMAQLANVKETEVNINYTSPATEDDLYIEVKEENGKPKPSLRIKLKDSNDKLVNAITGSVYGGSENGHVIENTQVTLTNGLIGHAVYGGGKGKGMYKMKILDYENLTEEQIENFKDKELSEIDDQYKVEKEIYSVTAGRVFGNTNIEMTGGHVIRNIYGGGNMGSVGKGNYAGGADDYATNGYGEKLAGNLWDKISANSQAFMNSGKTDVQIKGGTIGFMIQSTTPVVTGNSSTTVGTNYSSYIKVCTKDDLPTGNVFGGCRGESARNVPMYLSPRYYYCPEFYGGYTNETKVTIGDASLTNGPRLYGSVYGGGQDGHVRRSTDVTINKGEIGIPYNTDYQAIFGADLQNSDGEDNINWLHRGNVYGSGSGIGKYEDSNGEEQYSNSSGSVTHNTTVTVNSTMTGVAGTQAASGNVIYRNVYGGGSLATVGPPYMGQKDDQGNRLDPTKAQSLCTLNIAGAVGVIEGYKEEYGGEVYGASRGEPALGNDFASTVWTLVKIKNGANIMGNVFGGGDAGIVKKDTEVIVGE